MPESLQLFLAQEALRHAAVILADHAEILAEGMEDGTLLDQGGPEALRMFQAVIRQMRSEGFETVGNA